MIVHKVTDPEFIPYGKVLEGYDLQEIIKKMEDTPLPEDSTVYVPSDKNLEALAIAEEFRCRAYGGLPIQIGYCNGHNDTLNAIEYHRCSEINVAYQGAVLMVGSQQDIADDFTYDTGKMELFEVPAGCAVELYATTLHYAPCSLGQEGFQVAIILVKGTNEAMPEVTGVIAEDRLMTARNKWLIAHEESGLGADGAFVGLTGKNLKTNI